MKTMHHIFALALMTTALVAANVRAQAGKPGTKAALASLFDVEGQSPYCATDANTLSFSAYTSRFDSGHGHGYRNELKIADRHRLTVDATREHFFARVTPVLPAGARTIVAQYHVEGLDTVLKVYLQDTSDTRALDGKAGNGVFDVLARIKGSDGKEVTTALGTLRSGDSFDLDIVFDKGDATVTVKAGADQAVRSAHSRIPSDARKIYFKFGDYLQALDPATGEHTIIPARWDAYYQQQHIDASLIRFANVTFERQ
jgi:hypothetical protein